jgi:hypothetical protein
MEVVAVQNIAIPFTTQGDFDYQQLSFDLEFDCAGSKSILARV